MYISEKKQYLYYIIRIKHDAFIKLFTSPLDDKKFGQVYQQKMRCTLHRWDSMHLHHEQFLK